MTTRRAILSGLAALTTQAPIASAAPSADPAEVAFVEWLNAVCAYHGGSNQGDEAFEPVHALEQRVLRGLAPSPSAAAARILHELAYKSDEESTFRLADVTVVQERLFFDILAALRPLLTGRLAVIASDLVDNPARILSESMLGRAYLGVQPI